MIHPIAASLDHRSLLSGIRSTSLDDISAAAPLGGQIVTSS
jgi:hypothetical protein